MLAIGESLFRSVHFSDFTKVIDWFKWPYLESTADRDQTHVTTDEGYPSANYTTGTNTHNTVEVLCTRTVFTQFHRVNLNRVNLSTGETRTVSWWRKLTKHQDNSEAHATAGKLILTLMVVNLNARFNY